MDDDDAVVPGPPGAALPERPARTGRSLRPLLLAAVLGVLCQSALGMVVNLYVTVPGHHPGAHPSEYFAGSASSIGWALSHGAGALAAHVGLGLFVVVVAIGVAVRAVRTRRGAVRWWSVLGGLLVIGAGFNGASFLDFNDAASSLVMALLALGAVASYVLALYGERPPVGDGPGATPDG